MKPVKAWAVLDYDYTLQTFGDEALVPVIVLSRKRARELSKKRVMKQHVVRVEIREIKEKK